MPKENLSRHSVQNLGAWRCQRPEASSPFFRGDVSDALTPVGLDKRAGQIVEEGDSVPRGPAVVSRPGNLHQLKKHDAQNTQLCHKIRNIIILNHGDTFAVKFKTICDKKI